MSDRPPVDHLPPRSIEVLLVDDDPDFARVTATFLERHRDAITVETATSAEAGLDRIRDEAGIDCVVSDYDMPGTDGLAFLDAVRRIRPDLPFILLTGKGSEEIASLAISAGVTDYLRKEGGTDGYERLANRIVHATSARRAERNAEEARSYLRTVVGSATDAIVTIDESSVVRFASEAVERVFGYAPEVVEGEPLTMLMPERFRGRYFAALRQYREDGERRLDWSGVEFPGLHRDGHEVPLSISFGEFSRDGERYFTGVIRDVTDRKRREDRLAGLNELLAESLLLDDRRRLCDVVVEAAAGRLDLPVTAIALFDDDEGTLRLAARTPLAQRALDESALLDRGLAWEAFTSGESTTVDDSDRHLVDDSVSATHVHVSPLGKHGVFVTVVEAPGTSDAEAEFVETVVGNVKGALDRIERERTLREREQRLADQNEWLDRLTRITDVIRGIDRVLVSATTREEIERTVCAELADEGPHRVAWIGEYDAPAGRIDPREVAGDEAGFVDALAVGGDDGNADGTHPAVSTARTREPTVERDVLTDPPLEPWRGAALDRGLRSIMAIPLVYRDRLYGVLTVYADRPDAFDDLEREVLAELGSTIAHAINSVESTRALVSDEVVELEFEVDPPAIPFLDVVRSTSDGPIDLEGVVPSVEGAYRAFVTLTHADRDAADRLADSPDVRDCTRIADRGDVGLFECTMADESLVSWLLDHGAVPRSLSIDDRARVTVELIRGTDVRGFVEAFQTTYPGTDLVARRGHEREIQTRETFQSVFEDRLTPRQREVLRTAYFSGFFATPRERTGEEVASSLGISQPTFSGHVRASLRKLLGTLYDEGSDADL